MKNYTVSFKGRFSNKGAEGRYWWNYRRERHNSDLDKGFELFVHNCNAESKAAAFSEAVFTFFNTLTDVDQRDLTSIFDIRFGE